MKTIKIIIIKVFSGCKLTKDNMLYTYNEYLYNIELHK